jgi:hypothetical protein
VNDHAECRAIIARTQDRFGDVPWRYKLIVIDQGRTLDGGVFPLEGLADALAEAEILARENDQAFVICYQCGEAVVESRT